jgi:hypothetical protein
MRLAATVGAFFGLALLIVLNVVADGNEPRRMQLSRETNTAET